MTAQPTAPHRADRAGDLVDHRYRLVEVVGRGGLAVVWRAVDERLRRSVAVKLFKPDATDPAREQSELEVMARLSHPNLVTLYDGGVHTCPDGSAQTYLVMELVDGPTLHDVLDGSPAATEVAARVGVAVAGGLSHIHARGVIHRDVKPANILLPRNDGVLAASAAKLGDFGIARAGGTERLTEIGLFVGTAGYVSPEQVRGDELGPPSDIYSLALVLIEMLTGRPVYPGGDVTAATARLYRRPSVPTVGLEWTELLRSMCHDDPARRPSAPEVARVLSTMPARSGVRTGRSTPASFQPNAPTSIGRTGVLGVAGSDTHGPDSIGPDSAGPDSGGPDSRDPDTGGFDIVPFDPTARPWNGPEHRRRRGFLPWLAAATVVGALALGGVLMSQSGSSAVPAPSAPSHVAASTTPSPTTSTPTVSTSARPSAAAPSSPVVAVVAQSVQRRSSTTALRPQTAHGGPAAPPLPGPTAPPGPKAEHGAGHGHDKGKP